MLVTQFKSNNNISATTSRLSFLSIAILLAMGATFIVLDAVLPLYGLRFSNTLLASLNQRLLLPERILFPSWANSPALVQGHDKAVPPGTVLGWQETFVLLAAFLLVFICYLLALRYLPGHINRRYISISTLILGITCMLIPVATSPDFFSYIIYARMWTIYHLNPLVATPMAIRNDPVYQYIYWKDQPSAYGPVWILLTSLFQWLTNVIHGTKSIVLMVLALRVVGLIAHLWSTLLIWSIGGRLQELNGTNNTRLRTLATLAFAWNPLLLFEACVNAHNDAVVLFLVLLCLWLLVRQTTLLSYGLAALVLALATCLKVNAALLFPGLLIFLWLQPRRFYYLSMVLLIYFSIIFAFYAPFWNGGAILNVVHVNPGTYRNINTLADALGTLYNGIRSFFGRPPAPEIGSRAEQITHQASMILFVIAYAFICWRALFTRHRLHTLSHLIRWMAMAWFLYSILGAPWFWPWYMVTFFGLFALVEAAPLKDEQSSTWNILHNPRAVRVLAFSLLSIYCFFTFGVYNTFVPFLPAFRWAYLRGFWGWLPCLALLTWGPFRSWLVATSKKKEARFLPRCKQ